MPKRVQMQCWPAELALLGLKVQILAELVSDATDAIDGLGDE
jgi:hypothetical protein